MAIAFSVLIILFNLLKNPLFCSFFDTSSICFPVAWNSTLLTLPPGTCSRPEVFCKKGVLRNFGACNFIKKGTLAQVFSCEFCEISKNTFFYRTPLVAAFVLGRSCRTVLDMVRTFISFLIRLKFDDWNLKMAFQSFSWFFILLLHP